MDSYINKADRLLLYQKERTYRFLISLVMLALVIGVILFLVYYFKDRQATGQYKTELENMKKNIQEKSKEELDQKIDQMKYELGEELNKIRYPYTRV